MVYYQREEVLNNEKFHIASRGGYANQHPGNRSTRRVARAHMAEYLDTKKNERGNIARQVYFKFFDGRRTFVIERDYFLRCYDHDMQENASHGSTTNNQNKRVKIRPGARRKLSAERTDSVLRANGGSVDKIRALPAGVFVLAGESIAIDAVEHMIREEAGKVRQRQQKQETLPHDSTTTTSEIPSDAKGGSEEAVAAGSLRPGLSPQFPNDLLATAAAGTNPYALVTAARGAYPPPPTGTMLPPPMPNPSRPFAAAVKKYPPALPPHVPRVGPYAGGPDTTSTTPASTPLAPPGEAYGLASAGYPGAFRSDQALLSRIVSSNPRLTPHEALLNATAGGAPEATSRSTSPNSATAAGVPQDTKNAKTLQEEAAAANMGHHPRGDLVGTAPAADPRDHADLLAAAATTRRTLAGLSPHAPPTRLDEQQERDAATAMIALPHALPAHHAASSLLGGGLAPAAAYPGTLLPPPSSAALLHSDLTAAGLPLITERDRLLLALSSMRGHDPLLHHHHLAAAAPTSSLLLPPEASLLHPSSSAAAAALLRAQLLSAQAPILPHALAPSTILPPAPETLTTRMHH